MSSNAKFRKNHLAYCLSLCVVSMASASGAVAAERSASLEEVIVTAQKKPEAYTDVPVAVSTVSGEVLDLAKAQQFQDLVQVSPSVTFSQSGDGRGVGVNIRGMGTTAFQTGVEPTVSTVVDGVTMGRTAQFLSDLADVEKVEVLRGPQGTLFGKNASAGVINVVTKRPSTEFEGSVKVNATDDDAYGVQAQISGPLSDAVRGRLAVYNREYDGFVENLYTGQMLNGDHTKGVRGKLEFDLTESANLLLIADYSTQDRDCCVSPFSELTGPTGNRFWEFDYQGITIDQDNTKVLQNTPTYSNTETSGISAELNIEFDKFLLTSITAYRGFDLETQQDSDLLPYDGAAYGRFIITSNGATNGGNQSQEQKSQEFRITTTGWENVDVTAGLFFWNQTVDRYFEREVYACNAPDPADLSLSPDPALTPCTDVNYGFGYQNSSVETDNWALFGQANWHFTDTLTATLGWRYTEDDIKFDFARTTLDPGPAVPPSFTGSNSTSEENVSGKVSVQWDATDEIMLFASYAEGYKSPAFDVIFATTADRINPVPPETSEAWEAGMKAELFDRRLRLGITGFHTKFNDLQGQGAVVNGNVTTFILTSAGSAITQGLEVDFTAKPTPNLLLNGGFAWIDATFDEFPDSQCYPGQTAALGCINGLQDLSGKDIPNSPDFKFSLQARYDIELEGPVDMYFNLGYRWQDDSEGSQDQNPRLVRQSYDVVDLVVGLDADNGKWGAQLFAKNLLDNHYEDLRGYFASTGGVTHFLARDWERYIGAEFTYRFGAY